MAEGKVEQRAQSEDFELDVRRIQDMLGGRLQRMAQGYLDRQEVLNIGSVISLLSSSSESFCRNNMGNIYNILIKSGYSDADIRTKITFLRDYELPTPLKG